MNDKTCPICGTEFLNEKTAAEHVWDRHLAKSAWADDGRLCWCSYSRAPRSGLYIKRYNVLAHFEFYEGLTQHYLTHLMGVEDVWPVQARR